MKVKNKKIYEIILVCIISLAVLILIKMQKNVLSQPGSYQDPVITKSYLDEFYKFKLQNFKAGEKIVPGEGTQFILRAGKAIASGQFADLTNGTDLTPNTAVYPNHLIICPRKDGRYILSKTSTTFLVLGTVN